MSGGENRHFKRSITVTLLSTLTNFGFVISVLKAHIKYVSFSLYLIVTFCLFWIFYIVGVLNIMENIIYLHH